MEEPITPKIAVLAPAGSFSHQFALKRHVEFEPHFCPTLPEVLEAVKRREADTALVPFENSHSGSIKEIQKEMFLLAGQLFIEDLCYHHIELNLYSFEESIDSIVEVCSKDAALAQGALWLDEHLPKARRTPTASTAAAVKELSRIRLGVSALGSKECRAYGVPVLAESIQSEPNLTLFGKMVREIPRTKLASARFALLGLPDVSDEKFEKLIAVIQKQGCIITHNWVIEDMRDCPPNTGIFEVGFAPADGMIHALLSAVRKVLPETFLAGAYASLGFSEFNNIKHSPYAPSTFDY
jgi:prephenate dehydratase